MTGGRTDDATPAFLAGGGEMGALMRAHDWRATSLGDPKDWPQPLRTVLQILLNTSQPMVVWWGPELLSFYNDPYRRTSRGARHVTSLGRPAREAWSESWKIVGPPVEQVLGGGGATWRENQPVPAVRDGAVEESYWTYSYTPIGDETAPNGIGGVLVVCTETTEQVLSEQRLAGQVERQRRLFDQAPGFICILSGPDHVYEWINDAHHRVFNSYDWLGKPVREAFPDIADQGFFELLDQVYATGERFVAHAAPIRYRLSPEQAEQERFLEFIYEPVVDADGRVTGIFCQGHDITDAHLASTAQERFARHLQLMVDELNHRVKNTLAVVQGLAALTFRGEACEPARRAFEGRLTALAAAHDLLNRESWESADLTDIVALSAEAHGAPVRQWSMAGPSVRLQPKTAVTFALVLHELATNAAKYGALSGDGGRVTVTWTVDAPARRLQLLWQESGGPAVSPPEHQGFGLRMIERALNSEMGGEARVAFPPAGAVCEIDVVLPASKARRAIGDAA